MDTLLSTKLQMSPQLPFHHILYFCDGQTTINALCVSTIYSATNTSDLVKGLARRGDIISHLCWVPITYARLFIEHLIQHGVDIQSGDNYAIQWASGRGQLETVKYLVSLGADIRVDDDFAVRWASENGHLDTVKYLVSIGANIRADDDHAVRWASAHGHLETVKYLVSAGADVRANDDHAMQWASEHGHLETVKYLVSAGANNKVELL